MQIDTQFSIFLVNKPGVLAGITEELAKANININALALMDSGEHGTLRIVCDDTEKTRQVLTEHSDRWTEAEVLVMDIQHNPGLFAKIAKKLADNHINITYAYITGGSAGEYTTAVFKLADLKKAKKILSEE